MTKSEVCEELGGEYDTQVDVYPVHTKGTVLTFVRSGTCAADVNLLVRSGINAMQCHGCAVHWYVVGLCQVPVHPSRLHTVAKSWTPGPASPS